MKGTAWLVGVAAAVVVGAWVVGGSPPSETVAEPARAEVETPTLAGTSRTASDAPDAEPSRGRGSIAGRVLRDGVPVAARVRAWTVRGSDSSAALEAPPAAETVATEDGAFLLDGLASGEWVLVGDEPGRPPGAATVTVAPGAPLAHAVLRLPGGRERLSVRLVRADGSAFPGSVEVAGDVASPGVRTDATGAATLDGLRAGVVALRASGPGLLVERRVRVPRAEEFRIVMDAGATSVAGRVVDASGRGIAGARVTSEREDVRASATTDASGAFRIAAPEGEALSARARGYGSARAWPKAGVDDVVIVLPRAGAVSGRVVDARTGEPVAGVLVHASPDGSPPVASVASAEDGSFLLDGVGPGEVVVFALGGGFASEGLASVEGSGFNPFAVNVAPGATVSTTLRVVPAGGMRGHVTTKEGAPAAGVPVVVRETGARSSGCCVFLDEWGYAETHPVLVFLPPVPQTRTDASGQFEVASLVPGLGYTVRATEGERAHGRATATPSSGEVVRADVTLEVRATRRADVQVVDGRDRRPLADALVGRDVRTGTDGRAVVEWAEDWIPVRAEGYLEGSADLPNDQEGATSAPVVVALSPATWIGLRVARPEGAPDGRVALTVRAAGHDDPMGREFPVLAEGDGAFRAGPLPAGVYRAFARVDGDEVAWVAEAIVESGGEATLLLAPSSDPDDRRVRVEVVGPDGARVPAASVGLAWDAGGSHGWRSEIAFAGVVRLARPPAPFVVHAHGAVDASGLPMGLGSATAGPFAPDAAPSVRVALPPERTIEGRVTGPGGEGIAGVVVEAKPVADLLPSWGLSSDARSGPDGRFVLRSIGAGSHVVTAYPPPGFLEPEPAPTEGGARGVEVRLRRSVTARVTVLEVDGAPVAGASVAAAEEEVRWVFPGMAVESTGADGAATLAGLDPGKPCVLTVIHGARRAVRAAWTPGDVVVRLDAPATLSGVVRDAAGRPLAGVTVSAWTESSFGHNATTDAEGRFAVEGLPTGHVSASATFGTVRPASFEDVVVPSEVAWTIDAGAALDVTFSPPLSEPGAWRLVSPGPDGERRQEGTFAPGAPPRVEALDPSRSYVLYVRSGARVAYRAGFPGDVGRLALALAPERRVSGRLVPPKDVVLDYTRIEVRGPAFESVGAAEPDGRFEIGGLPEGAFDVEAVAEHHGRWLRASARVAAGGSVDLPVREDASEGP